MCLFITVIIRGKFNCIPILSAALKMDGAFMENTEFYHRKTVLYLFYFMLVRYFQMLLFGPKSSGIDINKNEYASGTKLHPYVIPSKHEAMLLLTLMSVYDIRLIMFQELAFLWLLQLRDTDASLCCQKKTAWKRYCTECVVLM